MAESRIWECFFQVSMALSILHEQKPVIVHRDIKAENVLICEDGSYKLCDFGSAVQEMMFPDGDARRGEIQEDIDRFTTMVYRSPEMVDLYMEKWIGDKADVWALGCLLFKMAYVVTPFEETGRLGIINARVEFPQTMSSSSYSDNLRNTIKWLLTPDPEDRPDIFDVLERVAPYARVSYSRNGKVGPKHPHDPAGYGESIGKSKSSKSVSSQSSAKKSDFMSSLDWQSSDSSTSQPTSKMHDFFDAPATNNAFDSSPNSFFASNPSQIAFESSPGGSSDWASFGNEGSAPSVQVSSFSAFDHPIPDRYQGGLTPVAPSASANRLSSGTTKSHRRSVSDSSAITASLANMNIASAAFSRRPVAVDISRIPVLTGSFVTTSLMIPSPAIAKELVAYSWASPKEQHVSKLFQAIAPQLGDHPISTYKGLHLIHRLLSEGSGLVLTLCINKLEWFRSLVAKLSSQSGSEFSAINLRYATYLVKRLEFHQAFEGCYEGSYSLDVYFAKLRTEGKKLQIGASDSPFRRQAVPSLLDCQSSAIALADACLMAAGDPSSSSLKLRLSLPILSDLCAVLLALQFVTTKLLATKTDFTKAVAQYDEHYPQMMAIFKTFKMIATQPLSIGFPATELAWAKSIKIPSFSATAPPIVKNSTSPTTSPPTVDPAIKSGPSMPCPLISEPIPDVEQAELDWLWQCAVLGTGPAVGSTSADHSPVFAPSHGNNVLAPIPVQSSSGGAISRGSQMQQAPSFQVESLRVSGGFGDSTGQASASSLSPAPSFAPSQAFTPPPAFAAPVPSSSTPSFDPFGQSGADSLSGSGGFTHGDPFQMAPSSSAPSISANPNLSGHASGYHSLTASTSAASASGDMFSSPSPAPSFTVSHGAPFSGSPAPVFATTFDSDPFIVAPSAVPAKRQLAASADYQVASFTPPIQHHRGGHKKRVSDHQHSGSFDAAGWAPSPGLTSEEKLKNKDYMNAQANEFASIQAQPANSKCFDCGDNLPKWISLNLGIFICFRCSGVHRSFGTHITKVRSIDLDVLTPEQISVFKRMGNARAEAIWLANVPDTRNIPDRNTSQTELERFLRDKYVFEEFKDKEAAEEATSSFLAPATPVKKKHTRTKSHQ